MRTRCGSALSGVPRLTRRTPIRRAVASAEGPALLVGTAPVMSGWIRPSHHPCQADGGFASAHFPKFVLHRGAYFHELRKVMGTRAPIPKFAWYRGNLRCELRNQRSSSNILI